MTAPRPYPPTGMTTAQWQTIPPETITYTDLVLTQTGVHIKALLYPKRRPGSDTLPHVVEWEGTRYLEDGHTRVVRAMLQGHRRGQARVHRP